ncbi:MAG TPA: hypothetical protein VMT91_14410, partial [Anaerolineales bacterium]|nr:hypothetical protein [Anaerolineales bacterium]
MIPEGYSPDNILKNRRTLIVEDDKGLSKRIAQLFQENTGIEPSIANFMQEATKILSESEGFDLVIIDIMLPKTLEDFNIIQEYEKVLDETRAVIEKYGSQSFDPTENIQLFDARYRRSEALNQINKHILREGGIYLVDEWHRIAETQNKILAVLFLTAVGNPDAIKKGLTLIDGISDWVVKPVSSEE